MQNSPMELPSIEEIEAMDRLRSSYIESLEFDSEQRHVKCQGCGTSKPVIPSDWVLARNG